KEFRIFRDFSDFKVKRFARVFFDSKLIYVGRNPKENEVNTEKLRHQANAFLRSHFEVVENIELSDYKLLIRMSPFTDYAIRNIELRPSIGNIVTGICRYPIGNIAVNCHNRTFYYFKGYEQSSLFDQILNMWLERVVMP